MRHRALKLGVVAVAGLSAALPLLASPAFADYAPSKGDAVGVGSDTLQYMLDFLADGDAYGDPGFNTGHPVNKLISIDATADANARLAYGTGGAPNANCAPGTGTPTGTGNDATTHAESDTTCIFNPTVTLRAGLQAVQRPNGSGAGFNALVQDIVAGHNTPAAAGAAGERITFARASSGQSTTATLPTGMNIDQLTIASDPLPLLEGATHVGTDGKTTDYAVSAGQLSTIYQANTSTGCLTWSDPRVSGAVVTNAGVSSTSPTVVTEPAGGPQVTAALVGMPVTGTGIPPGTTVASQSAGSFTMSQGFTGTTGTETVTVSNTAASTDAIIPIVPQVGSGTRKYFLVTLLGISSNNAGTCAITGEENDPLAVHAALHSADAIEPMSLGRLNVFLGQNVNGVNGGLPAGYFLDPSCAYLSGVASGTSPNESCGSGSVSGGTWVTNALSVSDVTTQATTGTAIDGEAVLGSLAADTRNLLLYFRSTDLTQSTVHFQPTSTLNWLVTLFYDPSGATTPFISSGPGQTDLQAAGVTPTAVTCHDITTNTAC